MITCMFVTYSNCCIRESLTTRK